MSKVVRLIHGYQPTVIECPYCGCRHGMRELLDNDRVRYTCWCGARVELDET